MEPKVLASVINTSTGRCWASEINNPVPGAIEKQIPSNNDYLVRIKASKRLKLPVRILYANNSFLILVFMIYLIRPKTYNLTKLFTQILNIVFLSHDHILFGNPMRHTCIQTIQITSSNQS